MGGPITPALISLSQVTPGPNGSLDQTLPGILPSLTPPLPTHNRQSDGPFA